MASDIHLDSGFSGDGKVTTDFGATDYGRALAVQSNGKILVAGFSGSGPLTFPPSQDFALARYNADGSLDASFSGDGMLTTDFAGWSSHGEGVAVQSDGKIVVAGGAIDTGSGIFDFAVARYNSNGTLDTSFSGDGKLTTDLGDDDTAYAVAIQGDGKIVVAGESVAGVGLARYTSDGSLDSTFGTGGIVTVMAGGAAAYLGSAMTLQSDGKILVSGYYNHVETDVSDPFNPKITTLFDFATLRFNANGTLDSSFSGDGIAVTDLGTASEEAGGVVVQSDGKILVSGHIGMNTDTGPVNTGYALVRYNANGSLDASFGANGIVKAELGDGATGFAVSLQSDGRILVSGTTDAGCTLLRYTGDGTLDTSFDGDGRFDIAFGGMTAAGYALRTLADGAILVAGTHWVDAGNTDFALAKLLTAPANLNLTGTPDPEPLEGGAGDDTLRGLGGNDTLIGYAGKDSLDGGSGADSMVGGADNDSYVVDNPADVVAEFGGEGIDLVKSGIDWALSANVENLTLTGSALNGTGNSLGNTLTGNVAANVLTGLGGNDTLKGGGGADILDGGNGNDSLDGGVGADSMLGGAGNDIYVVDNPGDMVSEAAVSGSDLVKSGITWTLVGSENIENLTLTGSGAINATGNSLANILTGNGAANILIGWGGNDTLIGNGGNDTLDGLAGSDSMAGGAGNDTYFVDDINDAVSEVVDTGSDLVESSVTWTLGAYLEQLTLIGSDTIMGIGNDSHNVLTGNGAANWLAGHDGNDTLTGNAGNDTLDGGGGVDSLVGGTGNDIYFVDDSGDVVVELAGGGRDTVKSSIAWILANNHENLFLTGNAAINATGNGLNNSIMGNANSNVLTGADGADTLSGLGGNDTLDGGMNADSMAGGSGNDTYVVNDPGDTVTELANAGNDLVRSNIERTLGDNQENLALLGTGAIGGTGNDLANVLNGNAAANLLSGLGGNDTLRGNGGNDTLDGGYGVNSMAGGAGNDTYVVSNGTDVVTELAGQGVDLVVSITGSFTLGDNLENLTLDNIAIVYASGTGNGLNNVIIGDSGFDTLNGLDGSDTLLGNWGDDNLMGGNGLDSLDGGNGEDTLNGGLGNDVLTGGADDDHFTFNTALSSTNVDTITDFGDGTDIIWLDDSIFSTWGNYYSETPLDGSAFYEADGATTAQDAYDRIIYDTSTGALYYDHDGVGGDASIQFATLSNQYAFLSAFNFHIYP
jgi:uncharacterized delta-60 repeat protein